MNDDLHKTFEPEPLPEEIPVVSDSDGWKMPEPVFRRSSGRVGGPTSGEVPKAPSTFVPARLRKKEAEKPVDLPPEIEPQPVIPDHLEQDGPDVSTLQKAKPPTSKLLFGIIVVGIVALVAVVSALIVSVFLGYIMWR